MASVEKRGNTYRLCASAGYDSTGKQIRHYMTWKPTPGMTEKQIAKELARQKVLFDERVNAGIAHDANIRFKDFADKWMAEYAEKQLKIKTVNGYQKLLIRINQGIGHIKLKDLRTGHLNSFYANLEEDGMNLHTGGKLSANSVRAYHRVISSILTKAVKWGYITFNPAVNAELPKQETKEAPHLQEAEARRLLELLHGEPIKYRAMITFDLLSGLRRGELLGLRWCDVDFANQTITIVQTSSYVSGKGVYTDTPKNKTSARPLKLSQTAFSLLQEYRNWQDTQRNICGDCWRDEDGRVFTGDDGAPIHPDALTKWFSKFIKLNNFPKVSIHSLRHTYASLMIADGTPLVVVSRRLGHAQVSTTANIYSHVIASADEKAAQISEKFADVVINSESQRKNNTNTA